MNNKKTILLVSSEKKTDTKFIAKLKSLGYRIVPVVSNLDAINMLTDNESLVNMVLLDIKLVKYWKSNKEIKKALSSKNIPILCMAESESDIISNNISCNFGVITKTTSDFAINQIISLASSLNSAKYTATETANNLVAILDMNPDLVWLKDINGLYLYCNIRFENFYGAKKAEIIGKTDYDFVKKEIADFFRNNDKIAIELGKPSINEETLTFANDGHIEHCETIKVPLYDMTGNVYGVVGIARDITERKMNEERLIEEKDYSRELINSLPGLYYQISSDGNFITWNKEFEKISGYSSKEISTMSPLAFFEGKDKNIIEINIKKAFSEGYADTEALFLSKDSTKSPYYFTAKRMNIDDEAYILGMGLDISDRKNLESDLRNSQKLKAIGTLASGIAHEINNPINGIMNYSQLILDESEGNENFRQYAGEIINETNRVAEIVKNLLRFSREEVGHYSSNHIEEIIKKTVSLIKTIIKRDQITLEINIEKNLPSIICRSQQIQQVMMNLLTNARDALNEKYESYDENKKIIISCRKITSENKDLIRLSVKDFGKGIPSEITNDIFNPFFTTKRSEKGTGLGLSISFGIIKEHNGNFFFTTEEGEFTKFCVDLPIQNSIDN